MRRKPARSGSCPVALILGLALVPALAACAADAPPATPCLADGRVLNFGFYASYEPVSYSADADPESAGFDVHRGYEADLLTAVEAVEGAPMFVRRGVGPWDKIWLLPAAPDHDMVGGGITVVDSRTRDAAGNRKIVFTSGHIAFRQSLLVRAGDAARLAAHGDLDAGTTVGVFAGTTGESRLLQLTGLADGNGVLAAGTRIAVPGGEASADGSDRYRITAAGASPPLAGRRRLHPPSPSMPQVAFFGGAGGEAAIVEALRSGSIDAVAQDEVGNREFAHDSGGAFVVTALGPAGEVGGFALAVEDAALAGCVSRRIDRLTDGGRIGFREWRADPGIFMRRAARHAAPRHAM